MPPMTLLVWLALEFLFLGTGVAFIVASAMFRPAEFSAPHPVDAGTWTLLQNTPLISAVINGAFIFLTFVLAIPGFLRAKDKFFLRLHSWALIACGATSLVVGLIVWVSTLRTRTNLGDMWMQKSTAELSALQKQFQCCGYYDANIPPFFQDSTCPNVLAAARIGPCVGPFSAFANNLLDVIFTLLFGFVGTCTVSEVIPCLG